MHSRGDVPAWGSKNQFKLANSQLGTSQLCIHEKWEKIERFELWGFIRGSISEDAGGISALERELWRGQAAFPGI